MTADHVWLRSEIQADLMVCAGKRCCRNAEPGASDGPVHMAVEDVAHIAVSQQKAPEGFGVEQHAFVERSDSDLERRVVQEQVDGSICMAGQLFF